MTLWIVLAAVLSYLLGVWGTYRVLYTRAVENHYKDVLKCSACHALQNSIKVENRSTCAQHTIDAEDEPLWVGPLIIAVLWLPIFSGYVAFVGIKWIVNKSFFPRGVQSPAKREWEALVQESRIQRNQEKLEQEQRKLSGQLHVQGDRRGSSDVRRLQDPGKNPDPGEDNSHQCHWS